mmetsp:Transcript_37608/g.57626  ORF Transcript_37608/g.57626 Transcript_37608/m.57626 type:complete len:264 (+) Transcript_37608:1067-1858(+)
MASGNHNLLLNKVHSRNLLGDGVFYLKTGVHLQEEEILVLVHQELHGTGGEVPTGGRQLDGLGSHLVTSCLVKGGGGGLLNDLLVSSLDGALSLGEVDVVAGLVSEDLELNMTGVFNVLFNENSSIAETRNSFILRQLESLESFLIVEGNSHSLTTTSSGGLDHDGVSDLVGDPENVLVLLDLAEEAGNGVNLGVGGQFFGLNLVSHRLDSFGRRSNEDDVVILQLLLEHGVLGQEAVAGVHGLGAGLLHDIEDGVHHQVGLV